MLHTIQRSETGCEINISYKIQLCAVGVFLITLIAHCCARQCDDTKSISGIWELFRENTKIRDSEIVSAVFRTITVLYCGSELHRFDGQSWLDMVNTTKILPEQI